MIHLGTKQKDQGALSGVAVIPARKMGFGRTYGRVVVKTNVPGYFVL